MNSADIWYVHSLEGAIMGMAQREAELDTISSYTIHIVKMVAERATNRFVQTEAVAWLNDNADVIEELGENA